MGNIISMKKQQKPMEKNSKDTFLQVINGIPHSQKTAPNNLEVNTDSIRVFTVKVNDVIKTHLKPLSKKKQVITDMMNGMLSNNDKEESIEYIRCQPVTQPISLRQRKKHPLKIEEVRYHYQYEKNTSPNNTIEWYVNFADEHLFGYYHQDLFAQDEIQCAEHILLPYISEYAKKQGEQFSPRTFKLSHSQQRQTQVETPILIKNVLRQAKINTEGMYGYQFFCATEEEIINRITQIKIEDKSNSNIIAISALRPSKGYYTEEQIWYTFYTAYRAFYTASNFSGEKDLIIHTGNWGCGAFGNNKQLIAFIQLTAAHLADVSELRYHISLRESDDQYQLGKKNFDYFFHVTRQSPVPRPFYTLDDFKKEFLAFSISLKLLWNVSDGN